MRSYVNKQGDKVKVTEEHLKTAVKLKKELQKSSPSRKTSWRIHKNLMEREEFYDSDTNENYRQMIKQYQKSIGELPEVTKYADMVSSSKLESIKELVGEISIEKRDNQKVLTELNKAKRDIIDTATILEEAIVGVKAIELEEYEYSEAKSNVKNSITVMMTDWHIGLRTSSYDYEIAKERTKKYADEIIRYSKLFNIDNVKVVGVGDLVEGGYLRPTQAFEIEFTYSEQIIKATEIINNFLKMLSTELNVTYIGSVLGNHSRMFSKGLTLSGDSAENIVDASVKSFIKLIDNKKIRVDDKKNSNYDITYTQNNKIVKVVHGDLLSKSSKDKISKFISSDNVLYDALLYGHFHHSEYREENNNRVTIGAGCLQGSTEYSRQLGYETIASQTIVIFEDNNIIPIKINLENT